jgi:hypothetical protein
MLVAVQKLVDGCEAPFSRRSPRKSLYYYPSESSRATRILRSAGFQPGLEFGHDANRTRFAAGAFERTAMANASQLPKPGQRAEHLESACADFAKSAQARITLREVWRGEVWSWLCISSVCKA